MKKLLGVITILLLTGIFAFTTIQKYTDIFGQLGIEKGEATETIFFNFQDGTLNFPYSTVIRKLALNKRAEAVKEIGDYIKAYTSGNEFAEKYKVAREQAKPQGIASNEEKVKARISEVEADIETTKADMKSKTGDMKKLYEASLLELNKELKALKNPHDPAHKYYMQEATELKDSEKNMYAEDIKSWKEEFPPTVKELIHKRLVQFLEFTKDIDFNAKLVKRGSKMVFADPALEAKDGYWKYCFRSGKETITAARQYAQQWLSGMQ
jgi:hypothetical protein